MTQKDLKKSASSTHYEVGACIRGEKVTAQVRKVIRVEVTGGTSAHKIHQLKLEGSVLCVIDRPMNYLKDLL
jgi:hypothetical protein